jgi:hypothetical protein
MFLKLEYHAPCQAGHDLERRDLIRELKTYDAGEEPPFYPWVETIRNQQGSLSWYTGSSLPTNIGI